MDDLVANFADQSIKAPDDLLNSFSDHKTESPNEDAYKYHFVDGSPAGSEHGRVAHPTAYPSMENNDSLLHIEEEGQQSTDYENENENENETGYNADIDEDDDAPAPSDNGENGFDDFAQRLIRLHRQDIDRDELLTVRALSSILTRPTNFKCSTATPSGKYGLEKSVKRECSRW